MHGFIATHSPCSEFADRDSRHTDPNKKIQTSNVRVMNDTHIEALPPQAKQQNLAISLFVSRLNTFPNNEAICDKKSEVRAIEKFCATRLRSDLTGAKRFR